MPHSSHAGIFAALARLFVSAPAEVEETLPVLISQIQATAASSVLDAGTSPPIDPDDAAGEHPTNVVQDDALVAPLNPLGATRTTENGGGQIFFYTIRPGDTIAGIAKSFDVSRNTILWANGIADARSLKVGDRLIILPVSGVRHEAKKGDTVSSIAKKYRASIEEVLQFNGLAEGDELAVGTLLIVPNGELLSAVPLSDSARTRSFASLPLYEGFYARPVIAGRRSRGLHGYNGVDLADSCGLPVLASADGAVLIARSSGWNGGYGRYVVVAHANSTQTLYAHLKELYSAAGQSVRQGEIIGAIGSSGNSTGCHVHFEVRGARNPF